MGEVLERAVTDSSAQALNERGLRPAVQPKIEIDSFEDGKDLEYSMAIELLPEITPMDFSAIELERVKITVPDEEVSSALERLAASRKESRTLAKQTGRARCREGVCQDGLIPVVAVNI